MPPPIGVEVFADRTEVRLSESLRVEVRIQGPTPLRIDLPKQWLAESSAEVWKIEPLGKPSLEDEPEGGQTWRQSFRLDPYLPGTPLPLAFSPVMVNDQEIALPSFSITVTTTVRDAKIENARPITGIETLPPKPITPAPNYLPWLIAGVGVVALILVLILYRRPKPKPEPTPSEWARTELAKLDVSSATFAVDMAALIRGYLRRRYSIPAEQRTAAELRAEHEEPETLFALLERCDAAKFAGVVISAEESKEMMVGVESLIELTTVRRRRLFMGVAVKVLGFALIVFGVLAGASAVATSGKHPGEGAPERFGRALGGSCCCLVLVGSGLMLVRLGARQEAADRDRTRATRRRRKRKRQRDADSSNRR